jgi:hypothetical protein
VAVIERARRVEEEDEPLPLAHGLIDLEKIGAGAGHDVPLLRPVGLEQHLRPAVLDEEQGVARQPDVARLAQQRRRSGREGGGERRAELLPEGGRAAEELRRRGAMGRKAGEHRAEHAGVAAHPPPQPVEQGGVAGEAPVTVEVLGLAGEDEVVLDQPRMRCVRSRLVPSRRVQACSSRITVRSRESQHG